MPTRPDPLSKPTRPDRLFYSFGVLLSQDDLLTEQTYHRQRLARVLSALFGSGTIAGLRAEPEPLAGPTNELSVTAGLALDRLGRLIEVTSRRCIKLDSWFATHAEELPGAFRNNSVVADLFVRFVPCERGRTPAFATSSHDALDAAVPSRVRDGFELELRPRETEPVPDPLWKDVPGHGDADAAAKLQDLILAAGSDPAAEFDEASGTWKRLTEQDDGMDTTSLLLARVRIPAAQAAGGGITRAAQPIEIDNKVRRFIYPPSLIAQFHGL